MLPNDEFNVNSRYARQDLRSDTRKIPNLRHCHSNNRLDAGADAHRVHCCHSTRCSLHVIAESDVYVSTTRSICRRFSTDLATLTSVNAM